MLVGQPACPLASYAYTVEDEAEVPCAELVASGFDGEVPPVADLLARRPSSVATAAPAAIRDALAATGYG